MKISSNKIDKLLEAFCLIMVIGIPIYICTVWSNLPEQLPMHYDLAGNVDRWGSRGELLVLPIITIIMYVFITVVEQFPKFWNTGVSVTEENHERVYRTLKYMIKSMKLIMVADFSYMTINTLMCRDLPIWFAPVFLLLVFGNLIFWLIRLVRVSKNG